MAILRRDANGKLQRKNGKLIRGECGCCADGPCPPGEQGLQCQGGGKTGMGHEIPVIYALNENARGFIDFDLEVVSGSVAFDIDIGGIRHGAVLVVRPGDPPAQQQLTICKAKGVASMTITTNAVDATDVWEYAYHCPGVCCEAPARRKFVPAAPARVNPLP